ncbi:hypothetical protein SPFL3102_03501 [Sporomusaceae bacterium FL31]|nr:hypothetical protein SPFL3101_02374 [Sporomusaceae bacterium FL31]GCE35650.1 hypothetical protein SPFL3102_03501 [Sporomusaceae bacterium]
MLLPGRVVARTMAEAKELIKGRIIAKGLILLEPVRPYPCNVQHLNNGIWWEYYVKVKSGA